MLDAIIILSFILAGAGIGYRGIEALPLEVQSQVSNPEALRLVIAPFGGLLGVAFGILAQTSYRSKNRLKR
jgi:uncharacterized protein YacL